MAHFTRQNWIPEDLGTNMIGAEQRNYLTANGLVAQTELLVTGNWVGTADLDFCLEAAHALRAGTAKGDKIDKYFSWARQEAPHYDLDDSLLADSIEKAVEFIREWRNDHISQYTETWKRKDVIAFGEWVEAQPWDGIDADDSPWLNWSAGR